MAIKKTLIRKESRSKNGKTWAVLVFTGKEAGTEADFHIFDAGLASKFSGPGEYEVSMEKNEKGFWGISEFISGPSAVASTPTSQPRVTVSDNKAAAIVAVGRIVAALVTAGKIVTVEDALRISIGMVEDLGK